MIPKDPVMLLSYVNTQLRDFYGTLDASLRGQRAGQRRTGGRNSHRLSTNTMQERESVRIKIFPAMMGRN